MLAKKILKFPLIFLLTAAFFPGAALAADSRLIPPDKIYFPALKFDLLPAERLVLENGIIIYILEDHELPLVNIEALVRTGSIYDPEGKEGVADLTAYVMRTGGTEKLTGDEIDRRFDLLAASAAVSMHTDYATVDFSALSKNTEEGIDLLAQIITAPAFEKNKLELAVQLKKEELRRLQDDPQRLAFREFNRLIYRNNPRGRMFSSASLSNIDREDLINFHRRFFQPNNIMFAVTGDITKEQAINLFTKYFGKWEKGAPANQTSLPAPALQAGLYFIDKDIPQSTIVCGQFAPGKHDPDYYAFTVLDFITGSGGFNSRIFNAVRNNKGLAYSAGSLYRPRSTFGLFVAYAFTKTSSTMQTLSLINTVLDGIKRNTLTANELDWAKQSINNGFIFSFSSVQDIAWQQMKSEFEKMPPDYLTRYRERIEKVTLEDLSRLAGLYLDKSNNVVLILGDYENFDKPADITAEPVIIKPQE